jgi:hypothetical protein
MINKVMMILQNCMDFPKVEPGLSSQILVRPPYSHNGNQISDIKVEVSDNEAVQDTLIISFPEIKAEHEVSDISACPPLVAFHNYPGLCTVFLISICLSVHIKTSPVC